MSRHASAGARSSIEQDEKSVRVAIAEEGGSGRETLEGDYLVGCDGARSQTREQIGIDTRRRRFRPAHGARRVPLERAA